MPRRSVAAKGRVSSPWGQYGSANWLFEVLIPRVARFELAGPVVGARSSFLNAIKELPLSAI
jgi:hypothetical protein